MSVTAYYIGFFWSFKMLQKKFGLVQCTLSFTALTASDLSSPWISHAPATDFNATTLIGWGRPDTQSFVCINHGLMRAMDTGTVHSWALVSIIFHYARFCSGTVLLAGAEAMSGSRDAEYHVRVDGGRAYQYCGKPPLSGPMETTVKNDLAIRCYILALLVAVHQNRQSKVGGEHLTDKIPSG